MKPITFGLLALLAANSVSCDELFIGFKLNSPAEAFKNEQKPCRLFINNILKAVFTKYDQGITCKQAMNEAFQTEPQNLNFDDIDSDYPNLNTNTIYEALYEIYKPYKPNSIVITIQTCKELQENLKANLDPKMFVFFTTLSSLSLSQFGEINGEITDLKISGDKAEISINGVDETVKSIEQFNFTKNLQDIKVILEYSPFYENGVLDINTGKSMIMEVKNHPDINPILADPTFFAEPTAGVDIVKRNNAFWDFLTAVNAGTESVINMLTAFTYRRDQPNLDNMAFIAQLFEKGAFTDAGMTTVTPKKYKYVINAIRIQVSSNKIGKVIIDGEMVELLII